MLLFYVFKYKYKFPFELLNMRKNYETILTLGNKKNKRFTKRVRDMKFIYLNTEMGDQIWISTSWLTFFFCICGDL